MLKDEKGNWVKILEIPEELWKKIMQETLHGVLELLDSAEILLDHGGNEAVCAGLYTYAMEEYGKIVLPKQSSHMAGKFKVAYRHGFRNHRKKFDLAVENLPAECKTLRKPIFDPKILDPKVFDPKQIIADLEARMAVFYCDFTDSGSGIKLVPPVDTNLLKKAINTLRQIALGIDFNDC